MPDTLTAHARVATPTPARYAKQLASHLGRRAEVLEEGEDLRIVLGTGSCLLHSAPDALEMTATAQTREDLETVMRVVGSHLERFGQRNELDVEWAVAGE